MIAKLGAYVRRGESLRPDAVARAAARVAAREGRRWLSRRRDAVRSTYGAGDVGPLASPLASLGRIPWLSADLLAACERYAAHELDVLGSGWVQVRHGMACRGLEGTRFAPAPPVRADGDGAWLQGRVGGGNLGEARRVWRLVDRGYEPIDWHIDVKSGYRWPAVVWYADVRYGGVRGADVKVPWEIGRGQHLSQLALAYHATGDERWPREIRNQILDFVAANPPRFGVQWCSTMDVAIRVANWLVAYDLCLAAGARFDAAFEAVLRRAVRDHARHIAENLEWFPTHRGNHYLADVVGLLFAAAYLPRSADTDAWLALAAQELVVEAERQFGEDGANFEASTCYHRLSAEMLLHGSALLLGLPAERRRALLEYDASRVVGPPALAPTPLPWLAGRDVPGADWLPDALLRRLERAGEFTWRITKPSGAVAQVGDNDSGRFLKLEPVFRAAACRGSAENGAGVAPRDGALAEDQLDHRALVAGVGALFARPELVGDESPASVDGRVVLAFAGGRPLRTRRPDGAGAHADTVRIGAPASRDSVLAEILTGAADVVRQELPFPGEPLDAAVTASAFPDFGLYVLRSPRLFLSIRCGAVGQDGYGGHAHNDQLAIELTVDGVDLLADPGSYIYTPLPERRNSYRSVRAHAAPRLSEGEPGRLDALFLLRDDPCAVCLYFGPDGFLGRHTGYGAALHRHVELQPDRLVVTDYLAAGGAGRLDRDARLDRPVTAVPFSPAYGVVCP